MEKGNIIIFPKLNYKIPVLDNISVNSVDLTLNKDIKIYTSKVLDIKRKNKTIDITIPETGYTLQPNELYIASTNEWTETYNFVPKIEGKSSLGRLGLFVHVTAGFGDVGFKGTWTLELTCVKPIIIYPNMKICQITYSTITEPPIGTYEGKYVEQLGSTPSEYHKNFESIPNSTIEIPQ